MAFLRITEHEHVIDGVPFLPSLHDQRVEIGVESKPGERFSPKTKFIELYAEDDACFVVGEDPKATDEGQFIGSGERLIYGVKAGLNIAVIASD